MERYKEKKNERFTYGFYYIVKALEKILREMCWVSEKSRTYDRATPMMRTTRGGTIVPLAKGLHQGLTLRSIVLH